MRRCGFGAVRRFVCGFVGGFVSSLVGRFGRVGFEGVRFHRVRLAGRGLGRSVGLCAGRSFGGSLRFGSLRFGGLGLGGLRFSSLGLCGRRLGVGFGGGPGFGPSFGFGFGFGFGSGFGGRVLVAFRVLLVTGHLAHPLCADAFC
ncbi:MAG: hypothetical protein CMN19_10140 [Roseovarius sp.]|nr:hypothetical protein [Roseovarius sp.]